MPKFAANLSFMFNEVPFPERFSAAANAGFKAVEFLFPYDYSVADITRMLKDNGLKSALFNMPPGDFSGGERGIASLPGREEEFRTGVGTAIAYALSMGTPTIHAMAGLFPAGAEREKHRTVYVENLKYAARELAKHELTLVIEPINTRDIPGYFLNLTEDARSIIHEVGAPNIGLQFDLYHRQVMQGDVVMAIREFGHLAKHYQIANPPDRGEPDDGELNYRTLFQAIDASGFTGWVGCEYKPRNGTAAGLGWVERCGVKLG